uniref:Retrovirus-related Pol polyprotein from transposon TNT 1-94 n=1 Tax=Cajanus cajan TaxID=3821 RepID=A0A151R9R9_CAJCA|nr:Retrovirus-related Pol polyprotein from transposon TNT 1-94 [Cajanus cajan]
METYLEALDLWEVVEEDYEILLLLDNPTMAQIKNHKEKKTRKEKAKSCLFAGVSTTIFTKIITLKSTKAIWDYLRGGICWGQNNSKHVELSEIPTYMKGLYIWKEKKNAISKVSKMTQLSEYTSKNINRFWEEAGIEHQLTTPYNSQQNGVSERRKKFWAEVAHTIVFLQNRLLTYNQVVKDRTPYEAWYGHKPSLNFLKIFGCLCFTHVSQSKHNKLDKRASLDIFIGYSTVSKAYKIFQPQTGSIVVNKDVNFIEDEE